MTRQPQRRAIQTAIPRPRDALQLASFTSSETALRGQAELQRRHAAPLTGIELAMGSGQHDRLGTVYRLRTGPFANLDEARAPSASFRSRDQDCLVTKTH